MTTKYFASYLFVLCLALVNAQFSIVTIDNFSTAAFSAQCNGPCNPVIESISGTGILGGSRVTELVGSTGTISIAPPVSGTGIQVDVTGVAANTQYSYNVTLSLIYDGNYYPLNPNGLGGISLYSGQGSAYFEFVFLNSAPRDFWIMNVTVYSGTNECNAVLNPCTSDSPCVSFIPVSEFSNCNLNSVGAVTVSFSPNTTSTQSSTSILLKGINVVEQVAASSFTPTYSPSPSPSAGVYTYIGSYEVNSGPYWETDPPTYTCQQACAVVFGGVYSSYHCSTLQGSVNDKAHATTWGVSGCQTVADNYSNNTYYDCGVDGCATSAYCEDNCYATNYCYSYGGASSVSTTVAVSPSRTPTRAAGSVSPSPSAVPSVAGSYVNVGFYSVSSGPLWTTNPPTYTCQQACALVFGGVYTSYHCSNESTTLNQRAFATSYGISGCQNVADTYSLNTNYDCGTVGCATSAYCQDNCYYDNYCWSNNVGPSFTNSPSITPSASASPSPSAYPSGGGSYTYVGYYEVNSGASWTTNPPTYTCQQACAAVFGGEYYSYHCSNVTTTMNELALVSTWGVAGCQIVADTYSLNTYYDCGTVGCATSAYVQDNCYGSNYCYSNVGVLSRPIPVHSHVRKDSTAKLNFKSTSSL